MIDLRRYQSKKVARGYEAFANGKVMRGDKRMNPKNMPSVSMLGREYSMTTLIYTNFIAKKRAGWYIRKIDHSKGYSVDNLISYPKYSKFAPMVSFLKSYITHLNKIRDHFGIQQQFRTLRAELRELDVAIKRQDVEGILEKLVDVFIVGLQIMLYFGINRSLNIFSKRLHDALDRIENRRHDK